MFLNLKKTLEFRMVSHEIKQINALRFTNVVLVCLIKVLISFQNNESAFTFIDKTAQLSIKTGKITFPWMLDPGMI